MKAVMLASLISLVGQADAEERGWIRVLAKGTTVLCRPDGSERTETEGGVLFRRQLSPDGASIAYVSDEAIHVADKEGKHARAVSPEGLAADMPHWSPDGKRIAFVGRRGEHWQVHTMDRDGKNLRQLTYAARGAWLPKFGPDGRLSYVSWTTRVGKLQLGDLVITDGAAKAPPKVVAREVFVTDYAWSPDGKTIAYGKPAALVFHELATGKEQEVALASIDASLRSHAASLICWRPDSQAAACSITFLGDRQQGGPKIFGDDELFVIPRSGKLWWFQPGVKFEAIEWIKGR